MQMLVLGEDHERRKVVILGDTQVGKTCITNVMRGLPYKPDVPSTIGVDYCSIDYKDTTSGNTITFDVYDTAGQEKFHSVTLNSLREAQIGLVVYDVTDRKSFEHVDEWSNKIIDGSGDSCIRFLIANKTDMKSKRVVKPEEGERKASNLGMKGFIEVSAKENINLTKLLQYMANEKTVPAPRKLEIAMSQSEEVEEKKKKCCGK